MIFWLINDDGSIFIIESGCGLIGGKVGLLHKMRFSLEG
jgi:hypothetical protein